MNCIEKMDEIKRIYDQLQDEESREIFLHRLEYILTGDADSFCHWFLDRHEKLYCPELDKFQKDYPFFKGYILFGAGLEGKITKRILEACGMEVIAWCDNDTTLWGREIDGIPVIVPTELLTNYLDYVILITVKSDVLEVYKQLLGMEIDRRRIFISQDGRILAFCGKQYFDFFEAEKGEKEIFVDGGSYNLNTSLEFIDWSKNDYKKIYVFEPDLYCFNKCSRKSEELLIKNIELVNCGLWNQSDELAFIGGGRGNSSINEAGNQKIELISLDEALIDEEVTFIKLDIEGSELEAIKGAKEIIRKFRPKIAVCLYHKPEDLWEIPRYILELVPDYKLYIRHYTTYLYETVLYAF